MAYVAISNDLKRDVRDCINNLHRAELGSMSGFDKFPGEITADPEALQLIKATIWGDMLDLEGRLAKYNFKTRVDLQVHYTDEDGSVHTREVQIDNVELPCFARSDKNFHNYYMDVSVNASQHPVFERIAEVDRSHRECNTRWATVISQVTTFVSKCKSLNEAIKLWPDVQRYTPKEYLDRVAKKVDKSSNKSEAADALAAIDVDMVNTSLVLARMSGAQV